MSDEIRAEQEKVVEHFKSLPQDEKQKQAFALMAWLQGYEVGYQSAMESINKNEK